MAGGRGEVKNAELLVGQPLPADAVAMKDAGMRRQTGQYRRGCVAFRPIEHFRQDSPVGLVPQVGMARLRASDDDAIKLVLPQLIEAVVEAIQMSLPAI